jgi:peptide/nickel transport system permease protein
VLTFIVRRVVYSVPVLLVASFLTFVGVRWAFDPLAPYRQAGSHLSAEQTQQLLAGKRRELHLNESVVQQWWRWLTGFVHGDMGTSQRTNDAVSSMLKRAMWPTLQLLFWGTLISLILAIGIGVYSATKQYSVGDYLFTGVSYIGIAMPPFWFALVAIALLTTWPVQHWHLSEPIFYSVGLHSTGQSGFNLDYVRHLVLPIATLTVQIIASWSRYQRASMLDVLHADYIRTARAKGLPRRTVVFRHAFRNALIPLVTVVALDVAFLFGGLIITEQIFAISGMGRLFFDSVQVGDAPVLLAWFVVVAIAVIVGNLLADILYGVLDPRIRVS